MTAEVTAALTGGVAVLERAINYTLGSLQLVTPRILSRPTPCAGWDLRALLDHMDDSLTALCEAADVGLVELTPVGPGSADDPVGRLRHRACRLLGCWASAGPRLIRVGEGRLTPELVAGAGAIEIAVHGWDVARACGADRRLPPSLATELLELAALLVGDADRPSRFAPPVRVPLLVPAGDQLLAFLGRDPGALSARR